MQRQKVDVIESVISEIRIKVVVVVSTYFSSRGSVKNEALEDTGVGVADIDLLGVQVEYNIDALVGVLRFSRPVGVVGVKLSLL